jgi:anti-sigma factor RsiW
MGIEQQIDYDDEQLLLYMADELDGEPRQRLEARLNSSPALRARLDALRGDEAALAGAFASLDKAEAVATAAPTRSAVRAVNQWNVERLAARSRDAKAPRKHASRWWMYPMVAAALLMIGMFVWWRQVQDESRNLPAAPGAAGGVIAEGPSMPGGPMPFGPTPPNRPAFLRPDTLEEVAYDDISRELDTVAYLRASMQ